ncbi:hypothetical protein MGYG_05024 [Nannizzia gypsea CBS 118893]|uniref:Uncharacterized protein n=1 Tax=Arthroderma gypseum (strain ATCC MYA-4604 / CBS 118893) TaxID=535722 RepID=E4UY29_ARTGP|nr:hypothetical protein MGYG_05024 [Nannizzia gypsea CBS 118893]EFR02022.1 hypothetical protein MGYG_05024 [Nannizzia gypsea CBS 118893]
MAASSASIHPADNSTRLVLLGFLSIKRQREAGRASILPIGSIETSYFKCTSCPDDVEEERTLPCSDEDGLAAPPAGFYS